MIAALLGSVPCGHSLGVLECSANPPHILAATLNSFVFDYALRARFSGLHASWFVIEDAPLPLQPTISQGTVLTTKLHELVSNLAGDAVGILAVPSGKPRAVRPIAVTYHERLRVRVLIDVLVAIAFGVEPDDFQDILSLGNSDLALYDSKGFWRVDQGKPPELRQTRLTMTAFGDLCRRIRNQRGKVGEGTSDFLDQNDGEGWLVPETVCLADYNLGNTAGARDHNVVAKRLGPRFHDWQLIQ